MTALDDRDRLVLAFVKLDAPGLTMDEDWYVMGQRAIVSGGGADGDEGPGSLLNGVLSPNHRKL